MADQKDLTGALFKNKRKIMDKHPDYTGTVVVGGVDYWLSAWINKAKSSGETYMSLNLSPKEERQATPATTPIGGIDDDIPFSLHGSCGLWRVI